MNETENQVRLRRAKESLAYLKQQENEARQALNRAIDSARVAKARYEQLFLEEERQECERRKANYNHTTK